MDFPGYMSAEYDLPFGCQAKSDVFISDVHSNSPVTGEAMEVGLEGHSIFLKPFIYLFICVEAREKRIFQVLVYSPNAWAGLGRTGPGRRQKPRTPSRSPLWVAGAQVLGLHSKCIAVNWVRSAH